MVIKYSLVAWTFNTARFQAAIIQLHETFSYGEMSELLGMSKSTVNNWARGNFSDEFPWPHMSNFLTVCNMCDLDPRECFTLADSE